MTSVQLTSQDGLENPLKWGQRRLEKPKVQSVPRYIVLVIVTVTGWPLGS